MESFLSPEECNAILVSLDEYRNSYDIPLIYRPERKRSLKYSVINGEDIQERLPAIQKLYESILPTVQSVTSQNVTSKQSRRWGKYQLHSSRGSIPVALRSERRNCSPLFE
jgi:hypothetical protein